MYSVPHIGDTARAANPRRALPSVNGWMVSNCACTTAAWSSGDKVCLLADAPDCLDWPQLGECLLLSRRRDALDERARDGLRAQQEAGDSAQDLDTSTVQRLDAALDRRSPACRVAVDRKPDAVEQVGDVPLIGARTLSRQGLSGLDARLLGCSAQSGAGVDEFQHSVVIAHRAGEVQMAFEPSAGVRGVCR